MIAVRKLTNGGYLGLHGVELFLRTSLLIRKSCDPRVKLVGVPQLPNLGPGRTLQVQGTLQLALLTASGAGKSC